MQEIFGHDREVQSAGQILHADFCALHVNDEPVSLVQEANLSAQRQVNMVFEAGTSNVHVLAGRPVGALQVSRFVGINGIFAGLLEGGACAQLENVSINTRGGNECSANVSQSLILDGIFINGLGIQWGAGPLEVRDTFSALVASINRPA